MSVKNIKPGQAIRFKGYDENVPEDERLLEAGADYPVAEVDVKENKVTVEIENPDFNAKKPANEKNPKTLLVEVFEEEFDTIEEEQAPAPVVATRTRPAAATAKTPARPTGTAPKAAAKPAAAAAKAPAKAATKAGAKAAPPPPAQTAEEQAADAAEEEEEVLEQEDEEIVKLVEEAGDGILDLAQELATESAAQDYRLGGVLYHIRLTKAYEGLDDRYKEKGGFGLYVKENLNVEYRKAMYLKDIYVAANKFGIAPETIARIGWTKAAKISEVMDQENAEELVKLAEENTVSDLVENIKASYKEVGGQKGDKKRMVIFKFRSFEDQAEVIQAALEGCASAMGFTGSKALDQAFEHIITEWATEHPVSAPAKTTGKKVAAPAARKTAPAAARPAARPTARPAARAAA